MNILIVLTMLPPPKTAYKILMSSEHRWEMQRTYAPKGASHTEVSTSSFSTTAVTVAHPR
ncbi:MAG: hypothetical protein E5V60_14255 [Mesorhizobium sp.]|nr:MAG: hypothetical protein E5V60_14255 [Mesorhizobium sp.]